MALPAPRPFRLARAVGGVAIAPSRAGRAKQPRPPDRRGTLCVSGATDLGEGQPLSAPAWGKYLDRAVHPRVDHAHEVDLCRTARGVDRDSLREGGFRL